MSLLVFLCLSSSSDDHLLFPSCLGTGMRVGTSNKFWRPQLFLPSVGLLVEQYLDTATSGTYCSDLRNCDNSSILSICARLGDGRSIVGSGALAWVETMARQWERVGVDPPPSFSAPTLAYAYTNRQWKRDLRLWQATSSLQKDRQGGWLLRQLKGESRNSSRGRHGRCVGAG